MITQLLSSLLLRAVQPMVSDFTWFNLVPGIGDGGLARLFPIRDAHDMWIIPTAWFICFGILGCALVARRSLDAALAKEGPERFIPDARFSPRALFEVFTEGFYAQVQSIVGKKEAPRFFPLVGAIFIYVVAMNVFGLLPGFLPATEVFSNNLAMALVVFVVFNWAGFTRNGFAYVKHLWGPIWWLGFLLFPIELLGLFIRPFSLTVRLTANMFADHLVAGTFRTLADTFGGFVLAAIVPVPLYFLGFFVCVVQAFVFALLTSVYVGLSTVDMKHGHGDGDGHSPPHP